MTANQFVSYLGLAEKSKLLAMRGFQAIVSKVF
jgi:hypothetical protein